MGRRAKPIELMLHQGNKHLTKSEIRKRREAEAKIRPPADDVACPAWLGPAGKREWKRVVTAMQGKDLITNPDTASLAVYCDAVDKYAQASRAIRKEGVVVRQGVIREVQANGSVIETNSGHLIQNPNVLVAAKYALIIRAFGSQFGLNPSARASLAIPAGDDKPKKDPFEQRFGS